MIRIGQAALRANALSFPLFGVYTVYSFLFLVMGKAKEGCFLGVCCDYSMDGIPTFRQTLSPAFENHSKNFQITHR